VEVEEELLRPDKGETLRRRGRGAKNIAEKERVKEFD